MSAYLSIGVRFATGRYHGDEWPPSPMRLFQALVAGAAAKAATDGVLPEDVRRAFHWLERLPPPRIRARPATESSRCVWSVPRNSDDLTMAAYANSAPDARIEGKRRKRMDLKRVVRRCVSGPLEYVWMIPGESETNALRLAELAADLYRFGRGPDAAYATAKVTAEPPVSTEPEWVPIEVGAAEVALRVPVEGSMQSLVERETARRTRFLSRNYADPSPKSRETGYARAGAMPSRYVRFYRLLSLDGERLLAWNPRRGVALAAAVRHALDELHKTGDPMLRAFATGHADPPIRTSHRLSWLPIPTVGHAHADGRVRRLMIAGPAGATREEMERALFGLHFVKLKLSDEPFALLAETDEMEGAVAPYVAVADDWATVTPLVLPGHTTRGRAQPGKLIPKKVEQLVLRALQREGYPEPIDLWMQTAPFHPGAHAAGRYEAARYMRLPQLHVRVRLARTFRGPLLAGVGRHYGLGLFAAVRA
jgi:CRISPR-associated protein Csb2